MLCIFVVCKMWGKLLHAVLIRWWEFCGGVVIWRFHFNFELNGTAHGSWRLAITTKWATITTTTTTTTATTITTTITATARNRKLRRRPHYAKGIRKRMFHSENACNVFLRHHAGGNKTQSPIFWICKCQRFWKLPFLNCFLSTSREGGDTPLYGSYRYVQPQKIWFFGCFAHK